MTTPQAIAFAALAMLVTVGATGITWLLWGAAKQVAAYVAAVERGRSQRGEADPVELRARVTELEIKVEALPALWEDMRAQVNRAAERERYYARKAGRRAQSELEEGEDGPELPPLDGSGSGGGPVQPVPEGMGALEPDHYRLGWARKLSLG